MNEPILKLRKNSKILKGMRKAYKKIMDGEYKLAREWFSVICKKDKNKACYCIQGAVLNELGFLENKESYLTRSKKGFLLNAKGVDLRCRS